MTLPPYLLGNCRNICILKAAAAAFPPPEAVQELQRGFLRELSDQRAAAALVHPAGESVRHLLLLVAAAVRLEPHMKRPAQRSQHWPHATRDPCLYREILRHFVKGIGYFFIFIVEFTATAKKHFS